MVEGGLLHTSFAENQMLLIVAARLVALAGVNTGTVRTMHLVAECVANLGCGRGRERP